jgi:hypothetical protein
MLARLGLRRAAARPRVCGAVHDVVHDPKEKDDARQEEQQQDQQEQHEQDESEAGRDARHRAGNRPDARPPLDDPAHRSTSIDRDPERNEAGDVERGEPYLCPQVEREPHDRRGSREEERAQGQEHSPQLIGEPRGKARAWPTRCPSRSSRFAPT